MKQVIDGKTVVIGTLDGDGTRPVIGEGGEYLGRVLCDAGPAHLGPGTVGVLQNMDVVRFECGDAYQLLW